MTTATTPPSDQHVLSALRRRRRLTLRYIDHNRPLQILALLLIYLLAIHYIFKFGAFHLPHSASKIVVKDDGELLLGIRGGRRRTSSAVGVSVGVGSGHVSDVDILVRVKLLHRVVCIGAAACFGAVTAVV